MVIPNSREGIYRFKFSGQEVLKPCNFIGFSFRTYDSRLGRFLSLDPLFKEYPFNSPFSFASNRVMEGVDYLGLGYQGTGKQAQDPTPVNPNLSLAKDNTTQLPLPEALIEQMNKTGEVETSGLERPNRAIEVTTTLSAKVRTANVSLSQKGEVGTKYKELEVSGKREENSGKTNTTVTYGLPPFIKYQNNKQTITKLKELKIGQNVLTVPTKIILETQSLTIMGIQNSITTTTNYLNQIPISTEVERGTALDLDFSKGFGGFAVGFGVVIPLNIESQK